jgi:hypothetical protein
LFANAVRERKREREREREREKERGLTRAPPRDDDEDNYDALGPDSRAAFLYGLRRRVFKFLLSSSCVGNVQLPNSFT